MRGFAGLCSGQLSVVRQSFSESALRPQSDGQNHECGHVIQLHLKPSTRTSLGVLVAACLQRMLECSEGRKIHRRSSKKSARLVGRAQVRLITRCG